ncbi:MAG: cytochrome c3 family protein [Planctomycetota bacterium]
MKWLEPKVWIAVLSAVAVAGFATVSIKRSSPGPVSLVHANVAELRDGANCAACHGGWFADMADACVTCHEPIAAQRRDGTGVHGRSEAARGGNCGACHGEHHGAGFVPTNDASFALAGFGNRASFDHASIGWTMAGRHLQLECAQCHEHADVKVLAEGQRRFAGLTADCASCHDDPHRGAMSHACADCHTQDAFPQPSFVDHAEHLSLAGGHGGLDCRQCHGKGGPHALERGERAHGSARECADCHDSSHSPQFLAGIAADAGLSTSATCATCHRAEHGSFAREVTLEPKQHAHLGFALEGAHALDCAACHSLADSAAERRYAGATAQCSSCHTDAHEGFFDSLPGGADCAQCHSPTHFRETIAAGFDHARDARFPVRGAHAQTECTSCHVPLEEPDEHGRSFGRIPPAEHAFTSCRPCHHDPHRGVFDRAEAGCAQCHGEDSFRSLADEFDHGRWTGFALRGGHATAGCVACHRPSLAPGSNALVHDRPRGTACADCHADPHAGQFAIAATTDCARCHVDGAGFAELIFDHDRHSRFALGEQHRALACAACHKSDEKADGVVRYKPLPTDCSSCHGEHRDPLRRGGRRR